MDRSSAMWGRTAAFSWDREHGGANARPPGEPYDTLLARWHDRKLGKDAYISFQLDEAGRPIGATMKPASTDVDFSFRLPGLQHETHGSAMTTTVGGTQAVAKQSSFARRVFLIAGIYGLIVMLPQYFLEGQVNRDYPPPITHPEYFYGFIGVVVAWQLAFLIIARDVVRFRPLMLAAVMEKATFAGAVSVLFVQGRLPAAVLVFGLIDSVLAILFIAAYRATPRR